MKKIRLVILLLLLLYVTLFFTSYRPLLPGYHSWYYTPTKYNQLKASLGDTRLMLRSNYSSGSSFSERKQILEKAGWEFQKELMTNLFPFWYGTFWTFNGRTEIPGESSIACGYFVTTTLRDMGVQLNRSKLAQVASEEMIKAIVSKKHIKWYNGAPINEFIQQIQKVGDAVFIIGLDNHTGYIISDSGKVWFIHSSGRFPFSVIKEEAKNSQTLIYSRYKVVGCLTKDEFFIKKWILAN